MTFQFFETVVNADGIQIFLLGFWPFAEVFHAKTNLVLNSLRFCQKFHFFGHAKVSALKVVNKKLKYA